MREDSQAPIQADRRAAADIPVAAPMIGERELAYVTDAVRSGCVSSVGGYVTRFEADFASYVGAQHAVSACNGTAALHLALEAAGVGPGDEVIVPALTYVASASVVLHAGARPIFVDCRYSDWQIDAAAVADKVTSRTKAIIPVHLYGHPSDMQAIMGLSRRHGLTVVEDAAEAQGATYAGSPVGTIGHAGVFSFFGNKIITTGEGGMITTDDDGLADRLRQLRNHGMDPNRRYWHPMVGYNYRMTNLQAALGVAQMESVDYILARKQRISDIYTEELAGLPLTPQPIVPPAHPVSWLVCFLVEPDAPLDSGQLQLQLADRGIDTRPFFFPVPAMPPFFDGERYPVAENLARRGISLPSSSTLEESEVRFVCSAVREFMS